MSVIKILKKEIADKIAAGEVVVNAASAIKELIENSIDAASTLIKIEANHGGKTLIRVTDDGSGISEEDIAVAFKRNATSKIAESLDEITTLGFRGEALASISAVAKVKIISKTAEQDVAVQAEIIQGEVFSKEYKAMQTGTIIEIRDLFYNMPARLKHLKKDSVETAQIIETVGKAALSHPEISISLICEGKDVFSTNAGGDIRKAAAQVLGKKFIDCVIDINFDDEPLFVKGFISSVNYISKLSERIIILNGRYVKSPQINRAVDQAYEEVCGKKGAAFLLYINLPYHMIDVNVHPAKLEVRLLNESLILMLIKQGIKDALSGSFIVKENVFKLESPFTLDERQTYNMVFEETRSYLGPDSTKNRGEKPPDVQVKHLFNPEAAGNSAQSSKTEASFENAPKEAETVSVERLIDKSLLYALSEMKYIGNAFGLYAMLEFGDEVYVIDTHAAHERVLYERYLHAYNNKNIPTQSMMVPIIRALNPGEHRLVLNSLDELYKIGFEADDIGDDSIAFRGIPVYLTHADSLKVIDALIAELVRGEPSITNRNEFLIKAACHSAVRGSSDISEAEVRALISALARTDMPYTCPHGRPTVSKLHKRYFMKAFERI